jgi:hypothetical protein
MHTGDACIYVGTLVSLETVSPAIATPSIIAITSPGLINPDLHRPEA